jgi:hypothetical protein
MAKRPSSRSQASDSPVPADKPTESKRPRRQTRTVSPEIAAASPAESRPTTPEELPDIPEPGDAADQAQRSESMASEPSPDDIRLRAYHRYLERGGSHGQHFDDWIEAERELKGKSLKSEV